MVEIELKFQVPAVQRAAVERALGTRAARTTRLRAQYFDTADRRLGMAGLALRLRQEGRRWVQTAKGGGDGALHRLEHEVWLPTQRGVPRIDVTRHAGSGAGEALTAALGPDAPELLPLFETDVHRTHRCVRVAGASIELALDLGVIRAGAAQQPVCELEFELLSGPLASLLALASRWARRHALWLDVRSKAERGDLLARGLRASPPATAVAPLLADDTTPDTALRTIVRSCLAQILPNAAALAAGCGEAEHLHQARVGLRRLDTALREFGAWSPAVDPAWRPALRQRFAALGQARDADAIGEWLQPALVAAGAPLTELPLEAGRSAAAAALREAHTNALLLELMAFAHGPSVASSEVAGAAGQERLARPAAALLTRLHRLVEHDGARFLTLDDAERHRTRRRLKRLRYGLEFFAALFPAKAVCRYLAQLRPAQDALGRYNDAAVARDTFQRHLEHDARAWFALGWLAAGREQWLQDAARALAALGKVKPGWTHHRHGTRRHEPSGT